MEKGVITPYFTGFYFTLVVNEGRGSLPPTSLVFTIPRRDGEGGYYPLLHRLLLYSGRERREGVITPILRWLLLYYVRDGGGVITG